MKLFVRKYFFHLALFLLSMILFFVNSKSGTYLTGWDNLQTDLYPFLGVKRAFFSVWQEYQSFGLLGGLAHASDLVRAIFVLIVSFILPQNFIRYFYHALMLFLGGIGTFALLQNLGFGKEKRPLAFLGALFYMFNLGTIQIFYVPFETFSHFFAFLPWEIWIFLKLIRKQREKSEKKRNLLLFLLINFLATPQAYIQTLFVVYLLVLGCFTIGSLIETKSFAVLKRAFFLFLLIILVNSFWLLPQMYFFKTQRNTVREAKINQIATENTYFQNREKGTFAKFVKLEGFYFDLYRSDQIPLFLEWKNHFKNPFFGSLAYVFATIMFLGLFSKRRDHLSLVLVLIVVAVGLLIITPPFEQINEFLRQNSILSQIFRSPFTKFIIPYSLIASYFFASGVNVILEGGEKRRPIGSKRDSIAELAVSKTEPLQNDTTHRDIQKVIVSIICVLLFLYALPAFQGYFFSPSMKVAIPKEYFEVVNFFKGQNKNKRVALLPDYTFWGWFYHRWGYNGSGFLWYGIEQPIVSRTFDIWSNKSESYFWEIKYAAEAENAEAFQKVLEKYNIDYLVLDQSLLPVTSTIKSLQYDRLEALLPKSKKLKLVLHNKYLSVYAVSHDKKIENFVSLADDLPEIGPKVRLTNKDVAYLENGDYKTDEMSSPQLYYPFLDLTTQTQVETKHWDLSEIEGNFALKSRTGLPTNEYALLSIPISKTISLFKDDRVTPFITTATAEVDKEIVAVSVNKTLVSSFDGRRTEVTQCAPKTDCFGYDAPFLDQRYGYIVKIDNNNIAGQRLFLFVLDKTKQQSSVEDRLSKNTMFYLLPPKYQYGLGYTFSFQNVSYENLKSVNKMSDLKVYLFPYDEIQKLKLIRKNSDTPHAQFLSDFKAEKVNYYTYLVTLPHSLAGQTLILNQSYHEGWKAYVINIKDQRSKIKEFLPFFFERELKNHVLVNNWANGWIVDSSKSKVPTSQKLRGASESRKVTIVFLPQYLEYIGFVFLIGTLTSLLLYNRKHES